MHTPLSTDEARQLMVESGVPQDVLEEVLLTGEPFYDTQQMQELFQVRGFLAPFVSVRRKSDGVEGLMMFTHSPRFYFRFLPDVNEQRSLF